LANRELTMERCLTCGAWIPPWRYDVYCRPCLDRVHTALAEALLDAFLDRARVARRERRRRATEAS
jgi:hypothetical protein